MAETTEIAWTDSTFNPWIGCQHVSPGCDHCYAEDLSNRRRWAEWGPHGDRRRTSAATWHNPAKWNANAKAFQHKHGHRQRVFCASLCDWLDNKVPREWRADLLELIDRTPELDWLMLTKRPENARRLLPDSWFGLPRPNVWFGFTAEDQERYDHRWPIAREIPARVHFVSYEPAIGALDIVASGPPYPDWVIFGGESGPDARPCDVAWGFRMVAQCRELAVSPFVKQLGRRPVVAGRQLRLSDRAKGGNPAEWPESLQIREFPA